MAKIIPQASDPSELTYRGVPNKCEHYCAATEYLYPNRESIKVFPTNTTAKLGWYYKLPTPTAATFRFVMPEH